ncbi:NmrA family NAD(P)-binding protein [Modestobacter sp. VKM Ac-2979]|uniref:NmrA family NAD(P)-binding protein n=1 Tax=unclassified Modestobacter TaxID=2643866 RepID=UPI0022AB6729|nr:MULTISPECIES: NmrA family NAD(P)-binding protein [unclassified Modestobacter]MCZ2813808.1 NmrA family NAD(P)-binding protein [Modestobacter sp. VKM Ac-2979]MCZ2844217.1 NmrA family NAD(P)-binding protein [Modestobacter sp. VKM Ac-2980]
MTTVLLAGASGDLGARTIRALVAKGADVRALVRIGAGPEKTARLAGLGATVVETDHDEPADLRRVAEGADVVLSTLNGLRDVMVGVQTRLLEAAVAAGVPRFIPSDFSADYRRVAPGSNRNFELRRDFARVLDRAPIRGTSVLNGAFADLLTGQAPIVLSGRDRVLYWGDADQPLDFTTKDDTAAFTADAALDDAAPRYLEVAGDTVTARQLAATMTELTGRRFRATWAGTPGLIAGMAKVGRAVSRDDEAPFPVWQGMQYLHSMFSGDAELGPLDNDRYGPRDWTTAREVLAAR